MKQPSLGWALTALLFLISFSAAAQSPASKSWQEAQQSFHSGQFPAAIAASQRVIQAAPVWAPAWRHLARCHAAAKDYASALRAADRYLQLQPNDSAFERWTQELKTTANTLNLGSARILIKPSQSQLAQDKHQEPLNNFHDKETTSWGLRLSGSMGAGTGNYRGGNDVQNSKSYLFQPGSGLAGSAELLVGFSPYWELALGMHPRFIAEKKESSSLQAASFKENMTEMEFTSLPLLLGLYGRLPVSESLSAELGLGGGFGPGGILKIKESTTHTTAAGLTHQRRENQIQLNTAPAVRCYAGFSWRLTARSSLNLGADFLHAYYQAEENQVLSSTVDAAGTLLSQSAYTLAGGHPFSMSSINLAAGLSFRY